MEPEWDCGLSRLRKGDIWKGLTFRMARFWTVMSRARDESSVSLGGKVPTWSGSDTR